MLHHPTLEKLLSLRLSGMHTALTEQIAMPDIAELSFEELTDPQGIAFWPAPVGRDGTRTPMV